MGTSVNQSSPKTLNWDAVHAGYRNPGIPIARVASEIWRAATNQPHGNLAALLSAPIIAKVGQLTTKSKSPADVSRATAREIVRTKSSSLATSIARRAAIQAFGSRNRKDLYYQRLFAEATSYLMARDFPGFVGSERARNVADSMAFKAAVAEHVASRVKDIGSPQSLTPAAWRRHVSQVISALQGKTRE